ncbi:hypothetical protein D3C81_1964930 [compost metagenome]
MAGEFGCLLQGFRLELGGEEIVPITLVDQQWQLFAGFADQHRSIPLSPLRTLFTQIARKGLLTPRAIHWVVDRRERRDRLVAPRVTQCAHQRTVATHGVTADAAFVRGREMRLDQCR